MGRFRAADGVAGALEGGERRAATVAWRSVVSGRGDEVLCCFRGAEYARDLGKREHGSPDPQRCYSYQKILKFN